MKKTIVDAALRGTIEVRTMKKVTKPASSSIKKVFGSLFTGIQRVEKREEVTKRGFKDMHAAFAAINALCDNEGILTPNKGFDGRLRNRIERVKNPQVSVYLTDEHITLVNNVEDTTSDQIRMERIHNYKDFRECVSGYLERNGLTVMGHKMFYVFSNERYLGNYYGSRNLEVFYNAFVKKFVK